MMSGRNWLPFTATQWQELEHQALIFKYMVSGVPIPPDFLIPLKRNLVMDSSLPPPPFSSRLFPHQPPMGWGCFQMGLGRKIDPEPGRCRRTDGKKWRCSKEAFPDSKYCERHMHRGRNRSRKPVEVTSSSSSSSIQPPSSSPSIPSSASLTYSEHHHHPNYYTSPVHHNPFLYPHCSSSRPPGSGFGFSTQNDLGLNSGSYSQADKDYRYLHGLKDEMDERVFFPELSLTQQKERNCSVLPNGYSQLQLLTSFPDLSKSQQQQEQEQHCFVLGTDFKSKAQREEPQQPLRHFFDEWPLKNKDSSFSTTQLSISIPMPSQDFPLPSSRK